MHIRTELTRLGIPFKDDHNSFRIVCPYPHDGSQNTHKNYGIRKDGKTSFCFVCRATGSWQKVAEKIGATKFGKTAGLYSDENASTELSAALRSRMAATALLDDDEGSCEIPEGMTPWIGGWRGFDESFLRWMNAYRWHQVITTEDGRMFTTERIWFPCIQWGEYVGFVSRRLDKLDVARYYNAPWMKAAETLFGFDAARAYKQKTMVLVEGPVDAMKLLAAGIPACAVLGTSNFGKKESMLRAAGWEHCILLYDNDNAGREGVLHAYPRIASVMQVEVMNLPEGIKDPGEMTPDDLMWLKSYVGSKNQAMQSGHP